MSLPPRQEVLAGLERVCASPEFSGSDRLKRFLTFVVELTLDGRSGEIKEFLIAAEVYGRGDSYDPQVNSVVRVEASRLRGKLRAYYENGGRADPLVIRLPRGAYVPEIAYAAAASVPPAVVAPVAPSPKRRRSMWIVAAAAGAVALVLFLWLRPPASQDQVRSIAVLPFVALGADGDEGARFADGITEDLTTAMSQLPGVRAPGRTTMLPFKGKAIDVARIARQVGVEGVVEGSIRTESGQIRVTAQLVRASDGYSLWANTYERRRSGNNLDLEREIARAISSDLADRISGRAGWRTAGRPQLDAVALNSFSEGLALMNSDFHLLRNQGRMPPELARAISLFDQVTERAPAFAQGWLKLAQICEYAIDLEGPGPSAMQRRATAAARKAIELDDTLSDAWATLATIQLYRDWDWDGAEASYRRAIELDPRQAGTQREYSDLLRIRGRMAESEAALEAAIRLEPESPSLTAQRAVLLLDAGKYKEATEQANRALAGRPDSREAHWVIGMCLQATGKSKEAEAKYRQVLAMSPNDGRALPALGHLLGREGRRDEALQVAARIEQLSTRGRGMEYPMALVMAGIGDVDKAFEWLEKAYARRDPSLIYLRLSNRLARLRDDPRFGSLLRRLRLE